MSFHIQTVRRVGIRSGLAFALAVAAILLNLGVRPVLAQTADTLDTNAKIKIVTAGEPTLSGDYTVDTNGDITMLYVNQVHVQGLTVAQARDKIAKDLGRYIRNPQIVVTLVSFGGISVEITGAVTTQGPHLLRSDSHLSDVIQLAKPALEADLSKIEITHGRPGEAHSKDTVDYLAYLNTKVDSGNPPLKDGDTIFVPTKNALPIDVNIRGQVQKPGRMSVPLKTTVADLIQSAGGITMDADRKGISIQHANSTESIPFDYDASREQPGNITINPMLQDGDTVIVKALQRSAAYTITGGVIQPAEYQITDAQVTLADAIAKAHGAQDRAKLDETTIIRTNANGTTQVIKVKAKDLNVQAKTIIQPGDNINIPPGSPPAPPMDFLRILSIAATVIGLASAFRRH